jgi:hypothetical protein
LFLSHFARGRVNVVLGMTRTDINAVEIVPIAEGHIEAFHRTLDIVARERRYLAFLEAPPLQATRTFILGVISQDYPQFVAMADGEVAGWCDIIPKSRRRSRSIAACSAWAFCRSSAAGVSASV